MNSQETSLTGTQINYYFICKRKMWLAAHNITFEAGSDLVKLGKIVHNDTYKRKRQEIRIDNIVIDHIEDGIIHEVKKSDRMEDAHIFQLLYYIYRLKQLGINTSGMLDYPKLKKKIPVVLTAEKEDAVSKVIQDAHAIISNKVPPSAEYKPICNKCAYEEFCWS